MVRLLKQVLSSEKGQALAIVLCLLAIGGLTIAVSLNYATTSLKSSRILEEGVKGVYAAEAGVEHTIWYLGKYESQPEDGALFENINRMPVTIQSVETGTYTMYFGGPATPGDQHDKLSVSGNISWVEGNRYEYEITVTQVAVSGQTIFLEEVGARIPLGYHYVDDSTTRSDVISPPPALDPVVPPSQDEQGADLLQWLWKDWGERPRLSGVGDFFIQTFNIEGIEGGESPEDHYAWVIGDPASIGLVGEIIGIKYKITAKATRPEDGRTTARIVAEVMIGGGMPHILSWQINPQ